MSEKLYTAEQLKEGMVLSAKHLHGVTDLELYVNQHIDNLPTTQAPVVPTNVREAFSILDNLRVRFRCGRVENDLEIQDSINQALAALAGEVKP